MDARWTRDERRQQTGSVLPLKGHSRLPRRACLVDGQTITYVRYGQGPFVILLHGIGGSADFWRPYTDMERLGDTYTLLCPDLLGFGLSAKPHLRYTLERHAAVVAAVLQAEKADQAHAVVGHSFGGVVAMSLLAHGALRVDRLALAATPFPSPRYPLREELLRTPSQRAMLTWAPLAYSMHDMLAAFWPILSRLPVAEPYRGAWQGYRDHTAWSYRSTTRDGLFAANLDPLIPHLQDIPTLLLYSRADQTVPFSHGERLAATLPQAHLLETQGNHLAILRPDVRHQIIRWLA